MTINSTYFQQALDAFQQNNFPFAQHLCEQQLKRSANADIFHLLALILNAQQKWNEAIDSFTASLQINNTQPQVHSNFANLLQRQGKIITAGEHYQKALQLDPKFIDARVNLTLLLVQQKQLSQASEHLEKAKLYGLDQFIYLKTKALIFSHNDNFIMAEKCYQAAASINNTDFNLNYELACVYRQLEQPHEAIKILIDLYPHYKHVVEVSFILGCLYYDINDLDSAENYLQKALSLNPNYVDAHEALNKLYWEQNFSEKFLQSYKLAFNKQSQHKTGITVELHYSKIAQLIMAERFEQAESSVVEAIKQHGHIPQFDHALAVIKNKQNRVNEAFKLFQHVATNSPQNTRYQLDLANLLIKQGEYNRALKCLNIAINVAPNNQEIWAYLGICWRLLNDEKAAWLNNYDQFIQAQLLPVPDNYDNLNHFVYSIEIALQHLHNAQKQPLDQSVKGGTQTIGNLLNKHIPVIQDYKKSLNQLVQHYINQLPNDPTHPFLRRNTHKFKIAGSWSVNLANQGYHTNHVHPEGWLSGPTYINVPNEISKHDVNKAGWVKFGETSLNLGTQEFIGKSICPEQGMVVLFPSYLWHGTYPFTSAKNRITTACDFQPI